MSNNTAPAPPSNNGNGSQSPPSSSSTDGFPLYDLVLDLPHPSASPSCPPYRTILPPSSSQSGNSPRSKSITAELCDRKSVLKILRFAFPEHDDRTCPPLSAKQPPMDPAALARAPSPALNGYDVTLKAFTSQRFVFALQLQNGRRILGHVRRYLPHHLQALSRPHVGRRGVRALVILSRCGAASGGGMDRFFDAVLKTVIVLHTQHHITVRGDGTGNHGHGFAGPLFDDPASPVTRLLHCLYGEYNRRRRLRMMAQQSQQTQQPQQQTAAETPEDHQTPDDSRISIYGVEFGPQFPLMKQLDTARFGLIPPPASVSCNYTAGDGGNIVPLLRRLGPPMTLRILSAVLCERRIILSSRYPSRLSACASAILSILARGDMEWPHVYVPILPPHLLHHLTAKVPYIVGVLAHNATEALRGGHGPVGEVVVVDLDGTMDESPGGGAPNSCQLRLWGMDQPESFVPDLLRPSVVDSSWMPQGPGSGVSMSMNTGDTSAGSAYSASLAECLASELSDVLKTEKSSIVGGFFSVGGTVSNSGSGLQEAAGKASKAVKSAYKVWKKKSSSGHHSGNLNAADVPLASCASMEEDGAEDAAATAAAASSQTTVEQALPTAGMGEAEFLCSAKAEEDAKIAFMSFFVCLLGEPSTFLSPSQNGELVLDRDKFIRERNRRGEYEGTPMYSVLAKFVDSKMFDHHARGRIADVMRRRHAPQLKPISQFGVVVDNLLRGRMEFTLLNVRRMCRQIATASGTPASAMSKMREQARQRAASLTSKQGYNDGNAGADLSHLTELCRDASGPLGDVMGVVWTRMRDCKGTNAKHGILALIVLRSMVLHGPPAVLVDAMEGLDRVKALQTYNYKLSGQNAQQIRTLATQVYGLLTDWASLGVQRRTCAERRRRMRARIKPRLGRDPRLRLALSFKQMHAVVKPVAGAVAVVVPQQDLLCFDQAEGQEQPSQGQGQGQAQAHAQSLSRPSSVPPAPPAEDLLCFDAQPTSGSAPTTAPSSGSFDMLSIMNAASGVEVTMGSAMNDDVSLRSGKSQSPAEGLLDSSLSVGGGQDANSSSQTGDDLSLSGHGAPPSGTSMGIPRSNSAPSSRGSPAIHVAAAAAAVQSGTASQHQSPMGTPRGTPMGTPMRPGVMNEDVLSLDSKSQSSSHASSLSQSPNWKHGGSTQKGYPANASAFVKPASTSQNVMSGMANHNNVMQQPKQQQQHGMAAMGQQRAQPQAQSRSTPFGQTGMYGQQAPQQQQTMARGTPYSNTTVAKNPFDNLQPQNFTGSNGSQHQHSQQQKHAYTPNRPAATMGQLQQQSGMSMGYGAQQQPYHGYQQQQQQPFSQASYSNAMPVPSATTNGGTAPKSRGFESFDPMARR